MITITKERLLTIKQWRETYGPDSNVVLPAEEAEELARIALASLEAEPVAWLHSDNGLGIPAITRSKNVADSWLSKGWYVQPLYIAQPVHVPEEMNLARAQKDVGFNRYIMAGYVDGWNACRAAILQSQGGGNQ
ncbi:valyl-tRNA synthetase [Escherichia coli]|nr:valyl-tRNA synthetase [Escherichia coli]